MLSEDIQKAIEKNLPAEMSKILSDIIKDAEVNRGLVAELTKLGAEKDKTIKNLSELNVQYVADRKRLTDFDDRLKELEEKERNLKVYKAELQRDEALKRADEQNNLIGQLFKSPIVRRIASQADTFGETYNNNGKVIYKTGHTAIETTEEE